MRKVRLAGKNWAVGIDWRPSGKLKTSAELVQKAQEMPGVKPDMIVVRGLQYGFGHSDGNPKAYSGLQTMGGRIHLPYTSFLGSFKLADTEGKTFRWVFARVEGDNIGGFSDVCYDMENDAEEALHTLETLNPSKFEEKAVRNSVEESEEYLAPLLGIPFSAVFKSDCKVFSLNEFDHRREAVFKKALLACVACAILYFCFGFAKGFWDELSFSSSAKIKQARIEQRKRYLQEHPEVLFRQHWQETAKTEGTFRVCVADLLETPLVVSGWELVDAECHLAKRQAEVMRTYGHTSAAVFVPLPPGSSLDKKSAKILHIDFPSRGSPGEADVLLVWKGLPEAQSVNHMFLQLAQALEIKSTLHVAQPEKKTEPEVGTFTCPWAVGSWKLEHVPPNVLLGGVERLLKAIPGLVLESVTVDKECFWKLSGKVYVR